MSEAQGLLRPTSVRPAGHFRYAIDLSGDEGPTRTIYITLRWEDDLSGWVASDIEGYAMSEPARFDTRPMVELAVAMHRAIHDQFPGMDVSSPTK